MKMENWVFLVCLVLFPIGALVTGQETRDTEVPSDDRP